MRLGREGKWGKRERKFKKNNNNRRWERNISRRISRVFRKVRFFHLMGRLRMARARVMEMETLTNRLEMQGQIITHLRFQRGWFLVYARNCYLLRERPRSRNIHLRRGHIFIYC